MIIIIKKKIVNEKPPFLVLESLYRVGKYIEQEVRRGEGVRMEKTKTDGIRKSKTQLKINWLPHA